MQQDDLIGFLNNKNGIKYKQNKKKSQKKINTNTNNNQQQQNDELQNEEQDIPFTQNFQNLYQTRMQKVKKKNQLKQLEQKKRLQILQATKIKFQQSDKILHQNQNQPIKLPTIRYLVFKSWSGNHLNYQVTDNGYKYKFTNGVIGLVKHTLQQNGFIQATDNQSHVIWHIGVPPPNLYQSMIPYQKINHFPKSFQITRKDLMLQNLSKMKSKFPNHYNFYPQTFILPQQSSHFMEEAQKSKNANRWYIVKPHNSSQGKGIWLSNKPQQILKKQKDCIVVSQYVQNPLLVNNLKFDMRIYIGITCWNPLRLYMFDDGLTRFATSDYSSDLTSKQNVYVHLTNYSLNKNAENFIPNDQPEDSCKGHKWSLPALRQHLRNNGYDVQLIWSRIQDLVIKTMISIQNTVFHTMQMQVPYRDNCFQVLGFDILLDDNLRPWLLEVNLSPSLNTDSALDLKIKGNMLSDLFTMIGMVSLDQRFSQDKTYLLNSNKAIGSKQFRNQMNKLQRLVIKQSQQQIVRSGGWKRIFPTETAIRYKGFFDVDRPLNRLLRDQQLKKLKNQKNVNYNQAIKQINSQNVQSLQYTIGQDKKKQNVIALQNNQIKSNNGNAKLNSIRTNVVNQLQSETKAINIEQKRIISKNSPQKKEQIKVQQNQNNNQIQNNQINNYPINSSSKKKQQEIKQIQKIKKDQNQQQTGLIGSIKRFFN